MDENLTEVLSLRLSKVLMFRLRQDAIADGRSVTGLIRMILKNHMEQKINKTEEVVDGLGK